MKLHRILIALAIASASAANAQSTQPADHPAQRIQATASDSRELLSEGEVRKVNREAGKITLRHGPLSNLDMPAMTMVFTATDPKLLDGLKEGDKVRFTADKKDGAYLVTAIQVAN